MQQLFMIPEFRRAILELPIPDEPPPVPPPTVSGPATQLPLLYQLQLMFGYLHESEKRSYDTRELCASYRDSDNRPINPSIQMVRLRRATRVTCGGGGVTRVDISPPQDRWCACDA